MAVSTRTPTGGTISINDCVITMGNSPGILQSMNTLHGSQAESLYGFSEIYGAPSVVPPYLMSGYYDIQGIIEYDLEYANIDPGTQNIYTSIYEKITGNDYSLVTQTESSGSPFWPNGTVTAAGGCTVPSGTQWHYRRMAVYVEVSGMRNATIDVELDYNVIGTIPGNGGWTFDAGGGGFYPSYASPLHVTLRGF